ncbi:hypothetical protein Belba_0078 [Belliella baltica DSM 15883]|uniref:Thiamine-binding protein domain-containing protein n=1 Tax=Belliella baltica (strain DSM 15883 / CIP 108006 / LMG 21964 / BA134) TaxID=866536 RepID=I3Z0I1_BELBD|nr:thiamine-binding protein [Belliella baltica]AFL82749.1 hypothetical protein Belba_0078 [Belliella baltica DSM 15883]
MNHKHIINMGIQIVPKSKNLDSYHLVDKAIEVIQKSGVKYVVTPFETVMEGEQKELMEIAQKAQEAVLNAGADEVLVYYRMQIRKTKDVWIMDKIEKYTP